MLRVKEWYARLSLVYNQIQGGLGTLCGVGLKTSEWLPEALYSF